MLYDVTLTDGTEEQADVAADADVIASKSEMRRHALAILKRIYARYDLLRRK